MEKANIDWANKLSRAYFYELFPWLMFFQAVKIVHFWSTSYDMIFKIGVEEVEEGRILSPNLFTGNDAKTVIFLQFILKVK